LNSSPNQLHIFINAFVWLCNYSHKKDDMTHFVIMWWVEMVQERVVF